MPKNAEKRAQHTVDYNNEEEIFYWLRTPPGGGAASGTVDMRTAWATM